MKQVLRAQRVNKENRDPLVKRENRDPLVKRENRDPLVRKVRKVERVPLDEVPLA